MIGPSVNQQNEFRSWSFLKVFQKWLSSTFYARLPTMPYDLERKAMAIPLRRLAPKMRIKVKIKIDIEKVLFIRGTEPPGSISNPPWTVAIELRPIKLPPSLTLSQFLVVNNDACMSSYAPMHVHVYIYIYIWREGERERGRERESADNTSRNLPDVILLSNIWPT